MRDKEVRKAVNFEKSKISFCVFVNKAAIYRFVIKQPLKVVRTVNFPKPQDTRVYCVFWAKHNAAHTHGTLAVKT